MKFISRYILTGLVTVLPVVLTLYFFYWMAVSAETLLGGIIRLMLPEHRYWPGLGVIAALVVLFCVGLLMHAYVVQRLFNKGEQLFYRMPLIKTIYRAMRDFFHYFSPASKKEFKQVVAISIGNTGMHVIGFVTQAIPSKLPKDFREEGSVLVYVPMSYTIGGYAVLTPRHLVRPLEMSMEEAMRFTLTAGVTGADEPQPSKKRDTTVGL